MVRQTIPTTTRNALFTYKQRLYLKQNKIHGNKRRKIGRLKQSSPLYKSSGKCVLSTAPKKRQPTTKIRKKHPIAIILNYNKSNTTQNRMSFCCQTHHGMSNNRIFRNIKDPCSAKEAAKALKAFEDWTREKPPRRRTSVPSNQSRQSERQETKHNT